MKEHKNTLTPTEEAIKQLIKKQHKADLTIMDEQGSTGGKGTAGNPYHLPRLGINSYESYGVFEEDERLQALEAQRDHGIKMTDVKDSHISGNFVDSSKVSRWQRFKGWMSQWHIPRVNK